VTEFDKIAIKPMRVSAKTSSSYRRPWPAPSVSSTGNVRIGEPTWALGFVEETPPGIRCHYHGCADWTRRALIEQP